MNSLNSRISDLENTISSLKINYVDIMKFFDSFKKKNMSYVFEKNFKHSYFNTQKHISIWVPKYLNLHEKENFITSYMNVRNDNDYVYANNWKSNSKWVWISKD